MTIGLLIWGLILFFFSVLVQSRWIAWLKRRDFKLAQKSYGPARDEQKGKTPSLGGAVFMITALPSILIGWALGDGSLIFQILLWSLPLASGGIGLWDDILKYSKSSSEGLSSLQKLSAQVLISLIWSVVVQKYLGIAVLPGVYLSPTLSVLICSFLVVSMLNGVNVTDGLDGLAAGASSISLIFICTVASAGISGVAAGLAMTLGFLWYNSFPARIFMGDCGSHFLGGLLVSISVCGGGLLYVVPAGALFGVEILSVAIQIVAIRVFSKKVFKMSPIHHHFELSGWSEVQIVLRFWILHIAGIVTLFLLGMGLGLHF
jgi:phospho-N-acetylmuramoyl-pentapeptide-transferase